MPKCTFATFVAILQIYEIGHADVRCEGVAARSDAVAVVIAGRAARKIRIAGIRRSEVPVRKRRRAEPRSAAAGR